MIQTWMGLRHHASVEGEGLGRGKITRKPRLTPWNWQQICPGRQVGGTHCALTRVVARERTRVRVNENLIVLGLDVGWYVCSILAKVIAFILTYVLDYRCAPGTTVLRNELRLKLDLSICQCHRQRYRPH